MGLFGRRYKLITFVLGAKIKSVVDRRCPGAGAHGESKVEQQL